MFLAIVCPVCGRQYQLAPDMAGKKVRCGCGQVFEVATAPQQLDPLQQPLAPQAWQVPTPALPNYQAPDLFSFSPAASTIPGLPGLLPAYQPPRAHGNGMVWAWGAVGGGGLLCLLIVVVAVSSLGGRSPTPAVAPTPPPPVTAATPSAPKMETLEVKFDKLCPLGWGRHVSPAGDFTAMLPLSTYKREAKLTVPVWAAAESEEFEITGSRFDASLFREKEGEYGNLTGRVFSTAGLKPNAAAIESFAEALVSQEHVKVPIYKNPRLISKQRLRVQGCPAWELKVECEENFNFSGKPRYLTSHSLIIFSAEKAYWLEWSKCGKPEPTTVIQRFFGSFQLIDPKPLTLSDAPVPVIAKTSSPPAEIPSGWILFTSAGGGYSLPMPRQPVVKDTSVMILPGVSSTGELANCAPMPPELVYVSAAYIDASSNFNVQSAGAMDDYLKVVLLQSKSQIHSITDTSVVVSPPARYRFLETAPMELRRKV